MYLKKYKILMSTLSDRLKELRGTTSQAEMARELGMPRPQWIRYETGKTVPGADILANICRIHAVSADWLLGIDRTSRPSVVIGDNSPVAIGSNAQASVSLGEAPACSKCPYKKRLAKIEKMLGK